jgi:hypothetical protein
MFLHEMGDIFIGNQFSITGSLPGIVIIPQPQEQHEQEYSEQRHTKDKNQFHTTNYAISQPASYNIGQPGGDAAQLPYSFPGMVI